MHHKYNKISFKKTKIKKTEAIYMLSDILHIHNPNNPSLPQGLVSDSPPVIYQGHVVHATPATSPVGLFPREYPRLLLKKKE